jgi:hypothetical protein
MDGRASNPNPMQAKKRTARKEEGEEEEKEKKTQKVEERVIIYKYSLKNYLFEQGVRGGLELGLFRVEGGSL